MGQNQPYQICLQREKSVFKVPMCLEFMSLCSKCIKSVLFYFSKCVILFCFGETGKSRKTVKTGLKHVLTLKHVFDSSLFCLSITDIFTTNTSCIGGIIQLVCKTKKLFFPYICFFYSLVTSLTHFWAH